MVAKKMLLALLACSASFFAWRNASSMLLRSLISLDIFAFMLISRMVRICIRFSSSTKVRCFSNSSCLRSLMSR